MAWEYTEKTKELFLDAVQGKPGTHLGEIADPDGFGEHGSIACGDALRFTFKVERHPTDPSQDIVVQARYLTFGCTSAIAASEALCALLEEGRYTPITALSITNREIVNYLGGLPSQKIHCSVMGAEALEAAVFNWAQKRDVNLSEHGVKLATHEEEGGRLVCKCFNVTEPYVKRQIRELSLKTIPEITNAIKAGGACMSCHHEPGGLQDLLNEAWGRGTDGRSETAPGGSAAKPDSNEVSPYQFAKKIEQIIDSYIRPMLQQDGGNIEIIDIKDRLVYARLSGACAGCAGAATTLKMTVEKQLQERVDDQIKVIAI